MTLMEVIPMIQTGDIILVKGDTPIVSRVIRWFTKSEYTHSAIAITENLVYEIDINKRLAIRPLDSKNYDVFRYKHGLTNEQQIMMQVYANEKAEENKGYDWLHILSFAIQKLFRTKKVYEEANKVICSEIVDNIYGQLGIDLVPDREDGDVTPAHLSQSPCLTKVISEHA